MGIISAVLGFASWLWGILKGNSKSQLDVEREAGEKTGNLESENAGLKQYIKTEQAAGAARDSVVDDPDSVYNDPANRNNPRNK